MESPDLPPLQEPSPQEVTAWLRRWQNGDPKAEERLVAAIYPLLRRLAGRYLGGGEGHTRDATELAHDAYLRLFRPTATVDCLDRQRFQAIAARVVRSLVVDYLRARATAKRGGGIKVSMGDLDLAATSRPPDWLELDEALVELESIDVEAARVVELRFFGGLTAAEISQVSSLSSATVSRRWRFARAWLRQRLEA